MSYFKFNCGHLTEQIDALERIERQMRILVDEADEIIRQLSEPMAEEPQIKHRTIPLLHLSSDIVNGLSEARCKLSQVVDIYSQAEKDALTLSERLPTAVPRAEQRGAALERPTAAPVKLQRSVIHNRELVVEDWLAALIYENDARHGSL